MILIFDIIEINLKDTITKYRHSSLFINPIDKLNLVRTSLSKFFRS